MKHIDTTAGHVKLVTFKKFLTMIPRQSESDKNRYVQFNMMVGSPFAFLDDAGVGEEDTSYYERRGAYLIKGDEQTVLKTALLYQATLEFRPNNQVRQLFEDLAVKAMEGWTNPTVLVRIDRRTWLATNPTDFRVYENNKGIALGIYRKASANIVQVSHCSEEEMIKATMEMLKNFGSYESR